MAQSKYCGLVGRRAIGTVTDKGYAGGEPWPGLGRYPWRTASSGWPAWGDNDIRGSVLKTAGSRRATYHCIGPCALTLYLSVGFRILHGRWMGMHAGWAPA